MLKHEVLFFGNEVCLSAREVMLRIVKPLRCEVSAEVGGTLHFTLCKAQYFTAACRCFTWA